MKRLRETEISEDRSRSTRHSSSWDRNEEDGRGDRDPIPLDLTFEILSRLPAKSLTRFCCVSKLWASIIRSREFINSFISQPWNQPRFMFIFESLDKCFIFSSPQPMNVEEESSSVATFHMSCPGAGDRALFFSSFSVYGLICCGIAPRFVVFNPSTGQSISLPKVKSRRVGIQRYFGYDPIDHQHKVLGLSVYLNDCGEKSSVAGEFQVLTLGAEKLSWRMIECSVPHYPEHITRCFSCKALCINGVLYYEARTHKHKPVSMIMSFDVRSEKFGFIKAPEYSKVKWYPSNLVNYKGKLAKFCWGWDIDLQVLEDAEKHEWSRKMLVRPLLWDDLIGETKLHFLGVNDTGEIVLGPHFLSDPFYVFYYNVDRSTVRRVRIEGITDEIRRRNIQKHLPHPVMILANHRESMALC